MNQQNQQDRKFLQNHISYLDGMQQYIADMRSEVIESHVYKLDALQVALAKMSGLIIKRLDSLVLEPETTLSVYARIILMEGIIWVDETVNRVEAKLERVEESVSRRSHEQIL